MDDFRAHYQPRHYIQIYTWRDCTLSELSLLLSDALPAVCPPRSRCGFRLIFADTRSANVRYTSKDLGAVVPVGGDPALDGVAKKTLGEVQFVVGDWIDVAIYPEGHGGVGGATRQFAGLRVVPTPAGRENGFVVRGGARGSVEGRVTGPGVPTGEWRRGERIEDSFDRSAPVGRGGGGFGRRGGGMTGAGRRYRE